MFCIKVSIKDKRTKPKESIPLSLLLSLSKYKFFEECYVSDVTDMVKYFRHLVKIIKHGGIMQTKLCQSFTIAIINVYLDKNSTNVIIES